MSVVIVFTLLKFKRMATGRAESTKVTFVRVVLDVVLDESVFEVVFVAKVVADLMADFLLEAGHALVYRSHLSVLVLMRGEFSIFPLVLGLFLSRNRLSLIFLLVVRLLVGRGCFWLDNMRLFDIVASVLEELLQSNIRSSFVCFLIVRVEGWSIILRLV